MAKALVLYYSKYGTTKKYAEWIAAELNGDAIALRDFKQNTLANYGAVVIGSGLYAGNIRGIDIIIKNYETLRGKKTVLFTCGLADYSKAENINAIAGRIEKRIPEDIRKNIKTYFLRGGIDYKRLGLIDRIAMGIMKKVCEGKVKKEGDKVNEETKEFIEIYGKNTDFMDKCSIKEIVEYCKG
jgi:menaquinone-dependent protoporphyrinogen IX oxidase